MNGSFPASPAPRAARPLRRLVAAAGLLGLLAALAACGGGGGGAPDGGLTSPANGAGAAMAGAAGNPGLDTGTTLSSPAPDFRLTNQFGQPISLSAFRGKVVILAFTDSECTTICPLTTASMVAARDLLGAAGQQVQLLGIDANPDAAARSDVLAYSRSHSMVNQWDFLTGSPAQLRAVWRAYHLDVQIERGDIDHTPEAFEYQPYTRWDKGAGCAFIPPARYVDDYLVDIYEPRPDGGNLADSPVQDQWRTWLRCVAAANRDDTGRPAALGIAEYGLGTLAGNAIRRRTLMADAAYLARRFPRFALWEYWWQDDEPAGQCSPASCDWQFTDPATTRAWHAIETRA